VGQSVAGRKSVEALGARRGHQPTLKQSVVTGSSGVKLSRRRRRPGRAPMVIGARPQCRAYLPVEAGGRAAGPDPELRTGANNTTRLALNR